MPAIVKREIGCVCPVAYMHSYAARPGNKGQPDGQRSVVAQFAQKTPFVIPKPGLSARNLLAASSGAGNASRDNAALRNDISFGDF
jgi:hypothetical protein